MNRPASSTRMRRGILKGRPLRRTCDEGAERAVIGEARELAARQWHEKRDTSRVADRPTLARATVTCD